MGRPRIEWNVAQLRAIMDALAALNRDFPLDNTRFLDGLVAVVRAATGRVYGATAYGRLLRDVAPQAGVARRPSTPTIQAAVLRAQALERGAVEAAAEATALMPSTSDARETALLRSPAGATPAAPFDVAQVRVLLAPLLREAIAPLPALLTAAPGTPEPVSADAQQLQRTTALEDAHARIRRLEQEMAELRRELGQGQAARDLAGEHVNALLADLRETIAASGRDSGALAHAAQQLAGTEKFLKAQNVAVRLQASAEAEALRAQNRQLRERIDHLLVDNDRYRRTLAARGPGTAEGR